MKIGVIGAGASGCIAAITAAANGHNVTILEKNNEIGKKILITGNGKCNLTNFNMALTNYYSDNQAFLEQAFGEFNCSNTISFFNNIGLLTKDKNGYVYPLSESAQMVAKVLKLKMQDLGIHIIYECQVNSIKSFDAGFTLETDKGTYSFDKIIFATGGKSFPKTGSDGKGYELLANLGLEIKKLKPALTALRCKEKYCKNLAGVRATGKVSVKDSDISDLGEIQFTDYGISGIPVFQISREVNYLLDKNPEVEVSIDFFPESNLTELVNNSNRSSLSKERSCEDYFSGILNSKIMDMIMKLAGVNPRDIVKNVPEKKLLRVFELMKDYRLTVISSNGFDNAQVTAGGVSLTDINSSMECKKIKGLFIVGEILDVDGKCGGYNLQWAWTSGYIAGKSV